MPTATQMGQTSLKRSFQRLQEQTALRSLPRQCPAEEPRGELGSSDVELTLASVTGRGECFVVTVVSFSEIQGPGTHDFVRRLRTDMEPGERERDVTFLVDPRGAELMAGFTIVAEHHAGKGCVIFRRRITKQSNLPASA